jgi:hypothetical protein
MEKNMFRTTNQLLYVAGTTEKRILTVDPKGRKGDPSENWWFLTAGEMDVH